MESKLATALLALVLSLVTACGKEAKAKPYPLTTCVVSGEKLGEMGKPIVIVRDGQEVKFCCKSCVPKFDKEPAKYMALITAAAKPKP